MKFEEVMSQLIEKFPRAQFQGVQNNKFSLVGKSDILEHTQRFLLDNSYSGEESDEELRLIYSGFLQPGWDTVPVGWAKIGGANGDFYVFAIGATGTRNEPTILKISSDGTITEVSQDVGVRYVFVS
jgi:hypothetical protein